jgi:hypothetical protein
VHLGQYKASPQQVICMVSTLVCSRVGSFVPSGQDDTEKQHAQALEAAAAVLADAVRSSVVTLLCTDSSHQPSTAAVPPALLVGALWVQAKLGGRPSSTWVEAVLNSLLSPRFRRWQSLQALALPLKIAVFHRHSWTSCHPCSCQGCCGAWVH